MSDPNQQPTPEESEKLKAEIQKVTDSNRKQRLDKIKVRFGNGYR